MEKDILTAWKETKFPSVQGLSQFWMNIGR